MHFTVLMLSFLRELCNYAALRCPFSCREFRPLILILTVPNLDPNHQYVSPSLICLNHTNSLMHKLTLSRLQQAV